MIIRFGDLGAGVTICSDKENFGRGLSYFVPVMAFGVVFQNRVDLGIGECFASFRSEVFADGMIVPHMHSNIDMTTIELDLIVRIVAD